MKKYGDFASAPGHQIALTARSTAILTSHMVVVPHLVAVIGKEGLFAIGALFRHVEEDLVEASHDKTLLVEVVLHRHLFEFDHLR